MPHAVIECSRPLEQPLLEADFLADVHSTLLESGEFAEADIKVRLYPCQYALIAGKPADFVHITVSLLSGRSKEVKKRLTVSLLDRLKALNLPARSLSVDARDTDRAVYSKVAHVEE